MRRQRRPRGRSRACCRSPRSPTSATIRVSSPPLSCSPTGRWRRGERVTGNMGRRPARSQPLLLRNKVAALIRPQKLDEVQTALTAIGVPAMSVGTCRLLRGALPSVRRLRLRGESGQLSVNPCGEAPPVFFLQPAPPLGLIERGLFGLEGQPLNLDRPLLLQVLFAQLQYPPRFCQRGQLGAVLLGEQLDRP